MFKTRKMIDLEEELCYWKQKWIDSGKRLTDEINKTKILEKQIAEKDDEIANLQYVKKENEIMKQYYKLNEDPSPEIQAKVLANLRLYDMEHKYILEKIQECKMAMPYSYYTPLFPLFSSRIMR